MISLTIIYGEKVVGKVFYYMFTDPTSH